MSRKCIWINSSDCRCSLNHTEWNSTELPENVTSPLDVTISPGLLIVLVLITVTTIVGNAIVIIVFLDNKKLRTPFNYYIFNLALADILVGVIAMPGFTMYNLFSGSWPAGETLCTLWMYFDWHMTFESAINLAVVSLDRYWSIRWPSWYRQHNSVRKTIIALILTWFYMHITFFPYYLYDRIVNDYGKYDCFWDLTLNRRFCIPVVILGYFLPLGVMIYCNCLIGCYVIKRARGVETSDLDDGKKGTENSRALGKEKSRRRQQPLISLAAITGCAFFCWTPWVIYFTVAPHYPTLLPDILVTVGYWMCYLNSTINPYLYMATSGEFRAAFRKKFSLGRSGAPTSQNSISASIVRGREGNGVRVFKESGAKRIS